MFFFFKLQPWHSFQKRNIIWFEMYRLEINAHSVPVSHTNPPCVIWNLFSRFHSSLEAISSHRRRHTGRALRSEFKCSVWSLFFFLCFLVSFSNLSVLIWGMDWPHLIAMAMTNTSSHSKIVLWWEGWDRFKREGGREGKTSGLIWEQITRRGRDWQKEVGKRH